MEEVWIIILSVIGLLITAYISIMHARNKKVVCPINSTSCNIVLDSKWSKVLGIKNEVLGLLYYVAVLLSLWLAVYSPVIPLLTKIAASLAALFSIFLVIIQIKDIKRYCFYCIFTAVINVIIFLVLVF